MPKGVRTVWSGRPSHSHMWQRERERAAKFIPDVTSAFADRFQRIVFVSPPTSALSRRTAIAFCAHANAIQVCTKFLPRFLCILLQYSHQLTTSLLYPYLCLFHLHMQYCSDTFFKKPFSYVVCICMFVPITVDSSIFFPFKVVFL